ncbi:MAG: zinc ribbon domain-containing protein [Candidatus Bipolaricaulota bacterium]|nr:zinc ribbon domain-containing protein [Candidatus Bipolaricaulota bacterium]MDW8140971.1 zinc ribbon domain-containing protein [Candidatus Bipolaricaulota bacterium]
MGLLNVVLLLLTAWAWGAIAQQAPVVIERLEISLWPEYDDPRLLVIYRGELSQDPTGPLTFALPLTAEVHAVAYLNAEGRLLKSDWQLLPSTEREQLVIFVPGSRRFQLEYYDEIPGQHPQKSFTFRFQANRYEINDLQIEVQQPLRAEEFVASPPLSENLGTDTLGLRYFGRRVGPVPAGVLVEQQISYTKRDNRPSVQANPRTESFPLWPLVGTASALLALGLAGIAWYWWERRRTRFATKRRSVVTAFCSGCGRAFRENEQFCPQCGRPRSAQ